MHLHNFINIYTLHDHWIYTANTGNDTSEEH